MIPTITAFKSSPDRGRGLARDMTVRWALEEVGQRYDARLVSFEAMKQPEHLAFHPFGQIPTYEEGDLRLVRNRRDRAPHRRAARGVVARRCECARARDRLDVRGAVHDRAARHATGGRHVHRREGKRGPRSACRWSNNGSTPAWTNWPARLGDADWLDGAFSAGDLMMATVLRRPAASALARGLSEPRRLRGPRRSAPSLQARV